MNSELKQLIYSILINPNTNIDEKYNEIINYFPNYLDTIEEKKAIYEKIEGFFHDGLGTYFEYLIYDKINAFFNVGLEETDKTGTISKLDMGKALYNKFFQNNEYEIDLDKEIVNIETGANKTIDFIQQFIGDNLVTNITLSSQDFREGNARDLFIKLNNGEEINFSVKTDKSGKVALFEGQTSDIFNKVYNRYFLLSEEEYSDLKNELFQTEDENEIFEDFQNIALLTQKILIQKLGIINAEVNNFKDGKITNLDILKHLIEKLKHYKNSDDNSIILLVNRETGEIGANSILDEINLEELEMSNFGFNTHKPKNKYNYGSTLGIKYKGETFVTFQIKHKRGKYASQKFGDITIRLNLK